MAYKYILIISILGIIFMFLGALLKILHWYGNQVLIIGTSIEITALLLLILKLIRNKNLIN